MKNNATPKVLGNTFYAFYFFEKVVGGRGGDKSRDLTNRAVYKTLEARWHLPLLKRGKITTRVVGASLKL